MPPEKIYEALESCGYKVYGVFLYGSQNYGTATPKSDYDYKVVVVPSLIDMVKRKKISYTMHIEDGLCDVKDIRDYVENLKKQNINYVETLFTGYFFVNPEFSEEHVELVKHAEEIARLDEKRALDSMKGNLLQSYKRMMRDTESTHSDIEQYGYHRKSLSNVVRLAHSIKKYTEYASYKNVLRRWEARGYKSRPKDSFAEVAANSYQEALDAYNSFKPKPKNKETITMLDNFTTNIIWKSVKSELNEN